MKSNSALWQLAKLLLASTAALVLASCGSESETGQAATTVSAEQEVYEWKMITSWPKNLPALGTSPEYFAVADGLITSWFGDLVMTLSVWALWYHALAGVRHLIWDAGYGLEVETAEKLGLAVIGGSLLLTIITILAV